MTGQQILSLAYLLPGMFTLGLVFYLAGTPKPSEVDLIAILIVAVVCLWAWPVVLPIVIGLWLHHRHFK